ncbi:uncharacterized protein N7506_006820 [Penicillium brevicompactum]|nr:uncharacterized protein N7506_006820 [Penicillium brevicompactum]KAJ5333037.1 hypothetical protein N7506_006820 [Penicillium brevicompactum]
MVYYTYVTYESPLDGGYGEYFNWVMVTPDQNTADTYYRALQRVKSVTQSDNNGTPGAKVDITSVDRPGAQFWTYDGASGENFHLAARALSGNPKMKSVNPEFTDVFGKIRVYWVGAYADGRFRTFTPQGAGANGSDTLSGSSFFVKRHGFDQYWYLAGGNVVVDSTRRSRFIFTIQRKHDEVKFPKMPLVDSDHVKIEVLQDGIRVPIALSGDNALVAGVGFKEHKFTFRDLKTRLGLVPGTVQQGQSSHDAQFVVWTSTTGLGSADSFEIVDGVEVDEAEE